VVAFGKGLGETGFVNGQKLAVEHYWVEGQIDLWLTSPPPRGRHRHAGQPEAAIAPDNNYFLYAATNSSRPIGAGLMALRTQQAASVPALWVTAPV
jgi:hypothetical protein